MVKGFFSYDGCPLCKKEPAERFGLCESCLDNLSFSGEEIFTEKAFPIYALLRENKLSSYMIQGLKFREERFWAKVFGEMAADFYRHMDLGPFDAVICVPTLAKKRRIRGYNPPELMARELAEAIGVPYEDVLAFKRKVRDQIGLGARERARNVHDAFIAHKVMGKHLLLIDDTYTTGATMKACEKALTEAGAASVTGMICIKARDVNND